VALGRENWQGRFDDAMLLVGDQLPVGSIYLLLAAHGYPIVAAARFAGRLVNCAGIPRIPGWPWLQRPSRRPLRPWPFRVCLPVTALLSQCLGPLQG
jgi:hypothetical protein